MAGDLCTAAEIVKCRPRPDHFSNHIRATLISIFGSSADSRSQILEFFYPLARGAGARTASRAPECELVFGISGRSREGNRIAHVGQARDVGDGAFKTQAKTRVRHRTVTAQISVPAVMLFVDAAFRHACI